MSNATGARARLPRFAGEAVRRARLSVVPARGVEAGRTSFVLLMAVLLVAGVAGLLAFNTSMQQRAFTLTAMQTKADALTARQQTLQMDLAALNDPQQLAARAKKLGMVVPPNAAAWVPVSNESTDSDPPNGISVCVCTSIPPGMTYLPAASIT